MSAAAASGDLETLSRSDHIIRTHHRRQQQRQHVARIWYHRFLYINFIILDVIVVISEDY